MKKLGLNDSQINYALERKNIQEYNERQEKIKSEKSKYITDKLRNQDRYISEQKFNINNNNKSPRENIKNIDIMEDKNKINLLQNSFNTKIINDLNDNKLDNDHLILNEEIKITNKDITIDPYHLKNSTTDNVDKKTDINNKSSKTLLNKIKNNSKKNFLFLSKIKKKI